MVQAGRRSLRLDLSAAGFMATSTSGASPGPCTPLLPKWTWKPETPATVPCGARISEGKSGKVAISLPCTATVSVKSVPASCMPSPESPANLITTLSIASLPFIVPLISSRGFMPGGGLVQAFAHCGLRFSKKAVIPSLASRVSINCVT